MSILINQVYHNALETDTLNILYIGYDGYFDTLFCKHSANHKFYGQWSSTLYPKPDNFTNIPSLNQGLNPFQRFHAIVCNNRTNQINETRQIAIHHHIPLIVIDHQTPPPNLKKEEIDYMKQHMMANLYISNHKIISSQWKHPSPQLQLIPYRIPYDLGYNDVQKACIMGNFGPENEKFLQDITNGSSIPITKIGNMPNSSIIPTSEQEIIEILAKHNIYINLTIEITIPPTMLLAMACGRTVISNSTHITRSIIEHGENGLIANNTDEFTSQINSLTVKECRNIGEKAQETVRQNFTKKRFNESLQKILKTIPKLFHMR